jgi:hypothetical protein
MRCPRLLASTALALVLALGAAPAALAQGRQRSAPRPDPENVTTYGTGAFEPENVQGTQHRPDGDAVRARRLRALGSLIRVRADFYPELKKSVERQ